jgi:hypothetical protein
MTTAETPTRRLVLADYFLGLATRAVSGGARPWRLYYESEEDAGRKPPRCTAAFSGDLYINGDIKDIASTYYPAIGPYDVTDPDVAEYHVLLAKSAGIDGFMAEFTLGQEPYLLNLVQAAVKHDFRIGVNWINQSHLAENTWRDRGEAMAKAKDLVRWMAQEVYKPCGVRGVDGRYMLLVFLAHPRQPKKEFDPFFSPEEVRILQQVAHEAGIDANFIVLPWEALPDLAAGTKSGERVWDGYFPWVWSSAGPPPGDGSCWTRQTTREQYVQRLRNYYEMAKRVRDQGRIGTYIGAVCPAFDDHKGQAWGEALKRHLPRDGGLTLSDTWDELERSGVDTALIITWNDWVESSQIEPSLELGDVDLVACTERIAKWKRTTAEKRLLPLPQRLFHARRTVQLLKRAGVHQYETRIANEVLDRAAKAIADLDPIHAAELLGQAEEQTDSLSERLRRQPLHAFWEHGFDSLGLTAAVAPNAQTITVDEFTGVKLSPGASRIGFTLRGDARDAIQRGHLAARLCIEYLDVGVDFVMVRVDAAEEAHQVIASFKKTDSGKWRKASMDLVNARFTQALTGNVDFEVSQRDDATGGVRMARIDGVVYSL